jgi:hypothetical protein
MKCQKFQKTPSGQWPASMEEDIFISESVAEQNREIAEQREHH